MALNTRFWIRFSLFNLLIVALLGTIMRYKIGFEFPYLNQKHIQHAHSHFAFIGWITHTLFVLMVHVIQKRNLAVNGNFYRKLIICNLVLAYSMLFSFAAQGYGFFSITFSTLSVLNSYVFAVRIFKDLKPLKDQPYTYWFIAALWFNIISSLGTFNLGFMMASHNFNQNYHLASLYFYLHFQYNGFFTFACIGLLLAQLYGQKSDCRQNSSVFWLFFSSCIPAYFLSVLWATLPLWIYVLMVAAAITQLIGWIRLLKIIKKQLKVNPALPKLGRYLFLILTIAVSAKFLLQLGSTIPWVSKLAFGFRPIVIAYLHLILLAIISVFIVTYLYIYKFLAINKMTTGALILFVTGVYLNELVLGVQGIASFSYTVVPYVNETLFGIAVLIVLGLGLLLISQWQSKRRILFTSAMRRS